jgi:hypothetical protein
MIKRLFLLCAVCLALTACGRRIRTSTPDTAPTAIATPAESTDPLGDEIEQLLADLEANNAASDVEIDQIGDP